MVKLVYCIRRKPGMSQEAFRKRWREGHAPLVTQLREALPMRRYVQSHTLPDPANDLLRASRGAQEPYDGITEVWIDGVEAATPAGEAAADAARRLLEDEMEFIDLPRSALFLTEEHEIF